MKGSNEKYWIVIFDYEVKREDELILWKGC